MHNFKKAALSLCAFILLFAAVSAVVIHPFLTSEHGYFQDSKLRQSLAGTVDFVTIGASNSLNGYVPQVLDEELGCTSYNLSGSMMKLTDRAYFLEKEFARNPIDTVVLDLSHDVLTRDAANEYAVCEEATFGRLDSTGERLDYLLHHVRFDDWLNLYSREFVAGMEYWMQKLLGNSASNVNYEAKGFQSKPAVDMSLSADAARAQYNAGEYTAAFHEKNVEEFRELIRLCQAQGTRVIVAVAPVPDSVLWAQDGWDQFYQWAAAFCQENGCEFYDMNLLRDRYALFSDQTSFADQTHMSGEGAAVYTAAFSQLIQEAETEDVSGQFYESYEALKADSPYMDALEVE